jgi:hypothetical protein
MHGPYNIKFGVLEDCAEGNIWTENGGSKGRVENTAL